MISYLFARSVTITCLKSSNEVNANEAQKRSEDSIRTRLYKKSMALIIRDVYKLTFFWPNQVTNHKSSEKVNSQVTSKSLVQVNETKISAKASHKYLT